jgi:uncharacterized repeat protein (TIGR03803 family)
MRRLQNFRLFTAVVVVLVLASSNAAHAQFSVVYNFGSRPGDPNAPTYSGIIAQGRDGNLYSTAPLGGANDCGAVFKVTPAGSLITLYSFTGIAGSKRNGQLPYGGLTLAIDGTFYGTTTGTVFAILPPCNGTSYMSAFKVTPQGEITALYSSNGGAPDLLSLNYAPPIQSTNGDFYGTTYFGGTGFGTIYKITPSGTLTTLYNFDGVYGSGPAAPLVEGMDGDIYGTTTAGGTFGNGVVFKITSAGELTVLYNFDGTHGAAPYGALIQAGDGNFYGTTSSGGAAGDGVVFRITPAGTLTLLHSMDGTTEGASPYAGLTEATDGKFYGVNAARGSAACPDSGGCGALFSITPGGTFTLLHSFDGTTGGIPQSTLLQSTNGVLYGLANAGGTGNRSQCTYGTPFGCGVFYAWKSSSLRPFVSLLPYSGKVGATIQFLGQGFTETKSVSFDGIAAKFVVHSDTYLTATVPKGATSGFVTVTTAKETLKSNKKFAVVP